MLKLSILLTCIVLLVCYLVLRICKMKRLFSFLFATLISVVSSVIIYFYALPYDLNCHYAKVFKHDFPVISLIEKKSPSDYNAFFATMKQDIQTHGKPTHQINTVSELLNTLLVKYGPNASNSSIYSFLKFNAAFDKQLIKINPELVLYHEFPEKFMNDKVDFSSINSSAYVFIITSGANDVVASGLTKPQPAPTADETKKAMITFREVVDSLAAKYTSKGVIAVLEKPDDPTLDKKLSAQIVIDFYDAIIAKGQDDAAMFIKATLVTNRQK